jgi:hypothetical protein
LGLLGYELGDSHRLGVVRISPLKNRLRDVEPLQGECEEPVCDFVVREAECSIGGAVVRLVFIPIPQASVWHHDPASHVLPSIIDDPGIALEDFESAAQMSFRGKKPTTPTEWRTAIERIGRLREELEGG